MKRKATAEDAITSAALDELLRLYNGWLAYLLSRLGERTVRVLADDLRYALDSLHCRVEREGNAYVIRMTETSVEDDEGGETLGGSGESNDAQGR